ncbi:MAG: hypothetical protein AAFV98_24860 [Chloroflexota bacterium]
MMRDWKEDMMFDTPLPMDCVPQDLSNRQGRILLYIYYCQQHRGFTPSVREIGHAVGIPSTSVVVYNLNKLAGQGYLRRMSGMSRGVVLKPVSHQFVYSVYPEERAHDPRVKVQHLQRENAYLKQHYEMALNQLTAERDALLARLERIELVLAV